MITRVTKLAGMFRFFDAAIFMAPPVAGMLLAWKHTAVDSIFFPGMVVYLIAIFIMAIHVFLVNDFSDGGQYRQKLKEKKNLSDKADLSSKKIAILCIITAIIPMLLLMLYSLTALWLGIGLLFLSIIYNTSFCGIHGKGIPIVSSLLHILGGALAFLLGYSYFAANSCNANIAAIAFGVFIAAGHLIQEIQDRDNDSMHNTKTLALWLGSKTVFFIAMSFFLISHLMIQYLVETGYFPAITWFNILAFFAVIVLGGMCFVKMTERNLFLFRMRYRLVYAIFGLVIFIEIIT